MKIFERIKNVFRLIFIWWAPLSLRLGSRRLNKWLKKNRKYQDPSLYDLEERWRYIRKKNKLFLRRMGIKVELIGEDNIPKTGAWITPNHTSNFDSFLLVHSLGIKGKLIPIAKHDLKENKWISGYINGADGFYLNRYKLRESVAVLNQAANFAKQNNRSVVVFPEGTRSLTTKILEFKVGTFKFPQKYALPITPVTIVGTLQARRWWNFHYRYVKIIVHKPIKAIEHIKIPTNILTKRVQKQIEQELKKYEKNLSNKEKKKLAKLKKLAESSEEKKKQKIINEIKLEREKENEYHRDNK